MTPTKADLPEGALIRKDSIENDRWGLHFTEVTDYHCNATLYENDFSQGWNEIGVIFLKWDGCCHMGLRDVTLNSQWVHFDGRSGLEEIIELMRWMWSEAKSRIIEWEGED